MFFIVFQADDAVANARPAARPDADLGRAAVSEHVPGRGQLARAAHVLCEPLLLVDLEAGFARGRTETEPMKQ